MASAVTGTVNGLPQILRDQLDQVATEISDLQGAAALESSSVKWDFQGVWPSLRAELKQIVTTIELLQDEGDAIAASAALKGKDTLGCWAALRTQLGVAKTELVALANA